MGLEKLHLPLFLMILQETALFRTRKFVQNSYYLRSRIDMTLENTVEGIIVQMLKLFGILFLYDDNVYIFFSHDL